MTKTVVDCPCGVTIIGADEEDLIRRTQTHLGEQHPDHAYTPDEIMFVARVALPGERPPDPGS